MNKRGASRDKVLENPERGSEKAGIYNAIIDRTEFEGETYPQEIIKTCSLSSLLKKDLFRS